MARLDNIRKQLITALQVVSDDELIHILMVDSVNTSRNKGILSKHISEKLYPKCFTCQYNTLCGGNISDDHLREKLNRCYNQRLEFYHTEVL